MSAEMQVRWGWLRFMYGYTIAGAGFFGASLIIAPGWVASTLGWPEQDPVTVGVVAGVYVAFALLSALGLREPLKFVPVLCLQLGYKTVWLIFVILPLLVAGRLPAHAPLLVAIFASYIVGDLIAIPFRYVFTSMQSQDRPGDERGDPGS